MLECGVATTIGIGRNFCDLRDYKRIRHISYFVPGILVDKCLIIVDMS